MLKIIRDGWTRFHSTRMYMEQKSIRNMGTDLQKAIETMPRIRPLNQPPKVWHLIERTRNDGKLLRFTIQEIPENWYEDVVEKMCTQFLFENPMCRSLNVKDDPLFLLEASTLYRLALEQGISTCVFVDNPDDGKPIIVGANVLAVYFKDKKDSVLDYQPKHEASKKMRDVLVNFLPKVVYKSYGVDKFLYAGGLYIDHNYRGYGLGKYMLKTRDLIGVVYGIPATASLFASAFAEKLAIDVGFEELLRKNYSDVVTKDGKEYFPNIDAKEFKIMGKRLL